MAVSGTFSGWRRDRANGRLALYYAGSLVGYIDGSSLGLPLAQGTTLVATTTMTAGTGWTTTTGNFTNTAGDHMVTAGNVRLGVVSAFATTEPTSAYIMKVGTAAAGAITTSGGIMTDGTNVQKIIADGTVSNVEHLAMLVLEQALAIIQSQDTWDVNDDQCDCTYQRIGYWNNPYIGETLEVRLCCVWAELEKQYPQFFRRTQIEPAAWNGETDMPLSIWYRQQAHESGQSLAEVRATAGPAPKGHPIQPKPIFFLPWSGEWLQVELL